VLELVAELDLAEIDGASLYARRKVIVEPSSARSNKRWASGDSRCADSRRSRRMGIVSLCHNVLKLFRRCGSMKSLAASPA
jgi:hypothetical protein